MLLKISIILDWLRENGLDYSFEGDDCFDISGFSSIKKYKKNSITWIKDLYKYEEFRKCHEEFKENISCAIVPKGIDCIVDNAIIVENPKQVFFSMLNYFWGNNVYKGSICEGTIISKESFVDPTASIGYNCSIIGNVRVGENTVIENNVVIQGRVVIGANCIIHSGAVIGGDGFGYYFEDNGSVEKIEHYGGVEIGDFVEIGCNACIDRGTIDDTVIGNNSKIDNLVHIAHNACVGKNVCVVAGAVVCGSVCLENGSYIAPGGIVKNQLKIGENAFVGLGAVVTGSVDEDTVVAGIPARSIRKVKKGDK